MEYFYNIYKPSGNDTALVIGLVNDIALRKIINKSIQENHLNVEQVGFIEKIKGEYFLEMAGGEFCGNATRSAVYYFLDGKQGTLKIQVSGTEKVLSAGIDKDDNVWVEMPISESFSDISIVNNYQVVKMDGITHVITEAHNSLSDEESLKKNAFSILEELDLVSTVQASGVMYITYFDTSIKIDPVVWVRDMDTLYYETACGSGTTAVGLYESKKVGKSIERYITQPSGLDIKVDVKMDGTKFLSARISGKVDLLKEGLTVLV